MARQEGIILLTGPVGDLSFYKMNGGYFVRRKSGVSGERIKSEPAYARTRENIAEFGRASLAAKLLRKAFSSLVQEACDNRVSSRLTGTMVKAIQGDTVNPRGQRKVRDGRSSLLQGFEFNKKRTLTNAFAAPFTASIDRATGVMVIDIPAFSPDDMLSAPGGATHFCLRAGGVAIDFEGNTFSASTCESNDMSLGSDVQGPLKLSLKVTPNSAHPIFLVLGIELMQLVNGGRYPLTGSNAMAIVQVDERPKDENISSSHISAVRRQLAVSGRKSFQDRKPQRFCSKPITDLQRALDRAYNHHGGDMLLEATCIITRDG